MSKLSEKIIQEIKDKTIEPKSRWAFLLKYSSVWVVILVVVVLMALIGSLLYLFMNDRFALFGVKHSLEPLIMMATVTCTFLVAIVFVRQTKFGYRYGIKYILFGLFFAGILFAIIFNRTNFNVHFDRVLSTFSFYENQEHYMNTVWQMPQDGRLIGEIVGIVNDEVFILKDINGKEWSVFSSGAIWRHNLSAVTGQKVKLIGKTKSDTEFIVSEVRPGSPISGCSGSTNIKQGSCMMKK